MNYRRSIAAVGIAGVVALAACGTDDQVAQPAAQPAGASQSATEAFQHYYDVTHPEPKTAAASQSATEAFRHYYDVTHPEPKTAAAFNGDAKDHPNYGAQTESPVFNGDAKDHPNYGRANVYVPSIVQPAGEPAGWPSDAKDHPNYGQSEPAVWPLRTAVSTNLEAQRVAFQVELAALAENEGLTGLSPAFLQRAEVCSGLSPASASGCTTDELKAALPGNPR
jgi:hypothetical protein